MHNIRKNLPISAIVVDFQPLNRSTFSLAQAIERGEFKLEDHPIHVQDLGNGRFKVKDGRHRLLAAKLLGFPLIPVRYSPLPRCIHCGKPPFKAEEAEASESAYSSPKQGILMCLD